MREDIRCFLEEYGFKDCGRLVDWSYEFKNNAYYYDTKMLVEGSHATDYAYLYYLDEENLTGLCYYSSLMEYLLTDFDDHGVDGILNKIYKYVGIKVELYKEAYIPLLVMRMDEENFTKEGASKKIGDMLKVVGMMDYLLQQRLNYLRKKNGKY